MLKNHLYQAVGWSYRWIEIRKMGSMALRTVLDLLHSVLGYVACGAVCGQRAFLHVKSCVVI